MSAENAEIEQMTQGGFYGTSNSKLKMEIYIIARRLS